MIRKESRRAERNSPVVPGACESLYLVLQGSIDALAVDNTAHFENVEKSA